MIYRELCPERALIFRITHRDNVPWILDNGLHCRNSDRSDPNFVPIGDPDLIEKRRFREVSCAPGGTLGDYIPFYFTPFSPMFFNIKTGYRGIRQRRNEEIAILVTSIHRLHEKRQPFLFTDRHAYMEAAHFTADPAKLSTVDWNILQRRDFRKDPENDPEKVERYEAEALVYRQLPVGLLSGIVCFDNSVETRITAETAKRHLELKVVTRKSWYF